MRFFTPKQKISRRIALAMVISALVVAGTPVPVIEKAYARLHGGIATGATIFSVPVSLNNLSLTNSYAAPMVSFVQPFADGDVPIGGSVVVKDSLGNPVTAQMDHVNYWPSGHAKQVGLSFVCSETFAATTAKNYTLLTSGTAPNNTPNSTTWGGTTQAQWAAALAAVTNFKMVYSGFDAGAATYDASVNRIITNYNNVTTGWGTSYPRGGWEVVKYGPVCVEFHFWEYIRNTSTFNTHGYVRCDFSIKAASPAGPFEIDAWTHAPNIWNTVPLSSTAENFNQVSQRFAAIAVLMDGATTIYSRGGPGDINSTTVPNANFNTATNRITSPVGSFFSNTGVYFTTSGSLPAGNMVANTIYWPTYVNGSNDCILVTKKSYATECQNNVDTWHTSYNAGLNQLIYSATSGFIYICSQAGTASSTGTGPTGTGTGIIDGGAKWDCVSLQFSSQGSGTINAYPIYASFASTGWAFVDGLGNPIWYGAGSKPQIFPGHDFTYMTTKCKALPPYAAVPTVDPAALNPLLVTNYSPSQPIGGLPTPAIDSSGDGVGDQRIGWLSEWAAGSMYRPTNRFYTYSTIQMATSMMNYPSAFFYDESGGHPVIGNNGTNDSGVPYTNFPSLIPAWNANNVAGSVSSTIQARGADWSPWAYDNATYAQNGYGGQYYYGSSHFPCVWQMPWWKTARYMFLEQGIAHVTALCIQTYLGTETVAGHTYRCVIAGDIFSEQLRGFGWAWRTQFQAMFITPANHCMYPYIRDLYDDGCTYQAVSTSITFPPNQGVFGFFRCQDPSGITSVGNFASWMSAIAQAPLYMEQWRGGQTPVTFASGCCSTTADYYANQSKMFDPTIDPNAPNYASNYRWPYGPNQIDWSTAETNATTVINLAFSSGCVEMAPFPIYPYDHDSPGPPPQELLAITINAFNWYGNMQRFAFAIRARSNPSDAVSIRLKDAITANTSARNGVSTSIGSFNWGFAPGINALAFCGFDG